VPATGPPRDLLAVILTGDGGWAEIDREIASHLSTAGVPVVGWNSLRYYWTPRTPEAAAADLDRILRHYTAAWGKHRVLLAGYSFGADVLPFLVHRLPPQTRADVAGVALVGLSPAASFEFHVAGWLGAQIGPTRPTAPEVAALKGGVSVTCIRGDEEKDSACLSLLKGAAKMVTLPGGHHVGGDYGRLAQAVLEAAGEGGARTP